MSIQETCLVVRFRQSGTSDRPVRSNMQTQKIADLKGKIKTLSFRVKKTEEVLKSFRKTQNLAGDYGNSTEHVKGVSRGEKVRKW